MISTVSLILNVGKYVINLSMPVTAAVLWPAIGCTPSAKPVYTGLPNVHWYATGMTLVDTVYTGTPLEK